MSRAVPLALLVVLLLGGCTTRPAPSSTPIPGAPQERAAGAANATPTSLELILRAQGRGELNASAALFARGLATFAPDLLPDALKGLPTADRAFFRDATDPALDNATRARLAPFLVRPLDPTSALNWNGSLSIQQATTSSDASGEPTDSPQPDGTTLRQYPNGHWEKIYPDPDALPCEHAAVTLESQRAPLRLWANCGRDEYYYDVDFFDGRSVLHTNNSYVRQRTRAQLEGARAVMEDVWDQETALMGPPVLDARTPYDNAMKTRSQASPETFADTNPDGDIDVYFTPTVERYSRYMDDYAKSHGDAHELGMFDYWRKVLGHEELAYDMLGEEIPVPPFKDQTSSGYLLLQARLLGSERLRTVFAHEFFHLLQSAHNDAISFRDGEKKTGETYWFVEASAMWAQAHFVRETAAKDVYAPYFPLFQGFSGSLNDAHDSYPAFVWPYEMEERHGARAIAEAWINLEGATDWSSADKAIDRVAPFRTDFEDFALRNLDDDFVGARPVPLHSSLDARFPLGIKPTPSKPATLQADKELDTQQDQPHLTASYQTLQPDDATRQIRVDASDLASHPGVRLDAVVHKRGGSWVLQSLPLTRGGQICDAREVILVVSNGDMQDDVSAFGAHSSLVLKPASAACGCDGYGQPMWWNGTISWSYHADVAKPEPPNPQTTEHVTETRQATLQVHLEREGPSTYRDDAPSGSGTTEDLEELKAPGGTTALAPHAFQGELTEPNQTRATMGITSETCRLSLSASSTHHDPDGWTMQLGAVTANSPLVHSQGRATRIAGSIDLPTHVPGAHASDAVLSSPTGFHDVNGAYTNDLWEMTAGDVGTAHVEWDLTPSANDAG